MRYDTVSMLSGALAFFVGRRYSEAFLNFTIKEMENKVYKEREQQRSSSKD